MSCYNCTNIKVGGIIKSYTKDGRHYCEQCNELVDFFQSAQKETDGKRSVPHILQDMADTYRKRNEIYGDNYKEIGDVLLAMFPNGIKIHTASDHNRWHLFLMIVVKMTRLANMEIKHKDSAHDLAVYGAMLESVIDDRGKE